jgi:hypothetical protein
MGSAVVTFLQAKSRRTIPFNNSGMTTTETLMLCSPGIITGVHHSHPRFYGQRFDKGFSAIPWGPDSYFPRFGSGMLGSRAGTFLPGPRRGWFCWES